MICDEYTLSMDVSNQIECQTKCEATGECLGISYNHKYNHICMVCMNDVLRTSSGVGFYRKPGNSKL
jgi:hypothetical protein